MKYLNHIILVLVVLSIFAVGFSSTTSMKVVVGGEADNGLSWNTVAMSDVKKSKDNTDYSIIDISIPVTIPIKLSFKKITKGCGSNIPNELNFYVKGTAKIYYDPNTGQSYFRLKEVVYDVNIDSDRVPTVQEVK